MNLRIAKWYLDLTTPSGDAAIVYSGRIQLGLIGLNYTALQIWRTGHEPIIHQCWRRSSVQIADNRAVWASRHPRARGEWHSIQPSPATIEQQNADGAIAWQLHQFTGEARLDLDGDTSLVGQGYVEHLEGSLAADHLPFAELRWGRFIGDDAATSVVWIDWSQGLERRWVLLKGTEVPVELLSDRELRGDALTLSLEAPRTLRDEPLVASAPGAFGWLVRLLPAGVRTARETKWLSRGTLDRPGHGAVSGWAIHEVVRWS